MKNLVLHSNSFETYWAHYSFFQDNDFIDKLESLGYRFFLSSRFDIRDADYVLFFEATSVGLHRFRFSSKMKHLIKAISGWPTSPARDVFAECQAMGLHNRTILIVFEGKIHLPENHIRRLGEMFPIILTWNDELVDRRRFFKYNWPQPVKWPKVNSVPFDKKKLLVNISANKYSSHPLELYSARRMAIRCFERKLDNQFDLYGIGWNKPATLRQNLIRSIVPIYTSYKGQVAQKADIFPQYKFSLCYENASVPGFVTEKVFDCMRSECVPIYLGAPNIGEFLPAETFIDRRNFATDDELTEFILNIDEGEYENYRDCIKTYLSGKQFSTFLSTSLAENLVDLIENHSTLS